MWQNPYANPNAKAAIRRASVWFSAYPISMITKPYDLMNYQTDATESPAKMPRGSS